MEELRDALAACTKARRLGVVCAQDGHTLEAVARAAAEGLVEPLLFGDSALIAPLWEKASGGAPMPPVEECGDDGAACAAATMKAVHEGRIDCIMKGKLETGVLMKAVVNRETGIRKNPVLSMIAVMESPYYHKLFAITDVGLLTYPDLEQKAAMIQNAAAVFRALGVECPKVAVLAAVEKVNPKMPETVDGDALKQMQQRGELGHCLVEGPISYDLCMDAEAAAIKGYESPVAGDPDILLVPDIVAGNLLSKALTCTGGAKTCGMVSGAMVPIVITSRSATAEDKYMSIILSALVGDGGERD
ncbi:MAG: phosphate acyltransferase [Oscillospiraceae bacterium]|nr:phosphate acyltransferase [Oscillospiraceae bacterium]